MKEQRRGQIVSVGVCVCGGRCVWVVRVCVGGKVCVWGGGVCVGEVCGACVCVWGGEGVCVVNETCQFKSSSQIDRRYVRMRTSTHFTDLQERAALYIDMIGEGDVHNGSYWTTTSEGYPSNEHKR